MSSAIAPATAPAAAPVATVVEAAVTAVQLPSAATVVEAAVQLPPAIAPAVEFIQFADDETAWSQVANPLEDIHDRLASSEARNMLAFDKIERQLAGLRADAAPRIRSAAFAGKCAQSRNC